MPSNVRLSPIRCRFSVKKTPSCTTETMSDLSVTSQRHLSRVKEDFEAADKDKSGCLSFAEVYQVLLTSGFKGTQEECKKIFKELDVDKSGGISKDEFCKAMARIPKIKFIMIVLRRAFKKIDADESGFLTRDEILAAASNDVGLNVTHEKLADMLIAHVKDRDQKVNYEEFLAIWGIKQTTSAMRTLFDQIDKDKSGNLTRDEMIAGIKSDSELNVHSTTISNMLVKWCKGQTVNYAEFCKFYEENVAKEQTTQQTTK